MKKIISLCAKGFWLSSFSFGNFIGPTVAGCLVRLQGFRMTTLVFFGLYCVIIVLDIFQYIRITFSTVEQKYKQLQ